MGARERLIQVLKVGMGRLWTVAWSPDGAWLAVGGRDGLGVITAEGREVGRVPGRFSEWVNRLTWSHDGQRLAALYDDEILIHEVATMRVELQVASDADVDWSPGDRWLASTSACDALVLDARTGHRQWALGEHPASVTSVRWSPEGRRLATGADDGSVRVWDATDARQISMSGNHTSWISTLSWSPDGRRLASVANDATVRVWNAQDLTISERMIEDRRRPRHVCWSPDGRLLGVSGVRGPVSLWDSANGELVATLEGHQGWVRQVDFSPDGTVLASGGWEGSVRLWDVTDI